MDGLKLEWLEGRFSVYRLSPDSGVPKQVWQANFCSITKTQEELSIVLSDDIKLRDPECSGGWCAFRVQGPLAHDMVGVIAKISGALAAIDCSVFTIATYDTDYILIPQDKQNAAETALTHAGNSFSGR